MFSKQFIPVFAIMALMAISITGFAQTKVVVIPLFGDDAPTSKIIFVTSEQFSSDLGGISGADDKCQYEADHAVPPVPGIFKAWLSTDITQNMQDRESFIKHGLPYKNVNGDEVAASYNILLSGQFNSTIDVIGDTNSIGHAVWTGTDQQGKVVEEGTCGNWLESVEAEDGAYGWSDGGVDPELDWTYEGIGNCTASLPLYCLEQ